MKAAMVSLDLLISLLVLLILGGSIVSFGFLQSENAVANGLKFKAEAYAMNVGSAINHFTALNADISTGDPRWQSNMVLDLTDPEPIGNHTLSGGWPAVGRVDFVSCRLNITESGLRKYVVVNITFDRWDSGFQESVIGKYPLTSNLDLSMSPETEIDCSGAIRLSVWTFGQVRVELDNI